jgi:hypothetical protein
MKGTLEGDSKKAIQKAKNYAETKAIDLAAATLNAHEQVKQHGHSFMDRVRKRAKELRDK